MIFNVKQGVKLDQALFKINTQRLQESTRAAATADAPHPPCKPPPLLAVSGTASALPENCSMPLTIATWNINSVRLRLPLVERLLDDMRPTCSACRKPSARTNCFRTRPSQARGYSHIAINGQKGYHGVATIARRPIEIVERRRFCGIADSRHLSTRFAAGGLNDPHPQFLCAGRRRRTRSRDQPEVPPQARLRRRDARRPRRIERRRPARSWSAISTSRRSSTMSGRTSSCSTWSATRRSRPTGFEAMRRDGGWVDLMRKIVPADQKLYTWWSYRARDWAHPTAAAGSTISGRRPTCRERLAGIEVLREARGWERPSDHVPVIARFDLD